ncbi:Uma2 family endonuclease [Allochromatium humboldtianum]|uniref:Uma2 family endonuclease n=1 Tax=Allochromatium humboldtianum TaxID=504901 RepID=A0A850RFD5_9GAMM|nr:Uma2 family endonuclease [Allochromatium humboldtianum]NVZ07843.1 Uma2 family endonuclease [Allochromatium humboldtianum]
MALQPKPSLSFDDWLDGERASFETRYEYVDGEVFAMSGGTAEHAIIIGNIHGQLWMQMKGRPCQVYASDMKLRIQAAEAGKYPDLMALCGEQQFHDGRRDLLLNPSLIVEVLSSSTEAYDRGDKFALYRRLPSLREYLLVAQHRVQLELYTRGDDERWMLTSVDDLAGFVHLSSVGCTLTVAEVYDKVVFAAERTV